MAGLVVPGRRVAVEHLEDQVGVRGEPRRCRVRLELACFGCSLGAVERGGQPHVGLGEAHCEDVRFDAGPLVEQVPGQGAEVDGDLGRVRRRGLARTQGERDPVPPGAVAWSVRQA